MSAYAYPSSTGDRSSRYGSSDDAQSVRDGSQTGSSSTRREQLPPITSLLGAAASSVRPMHSPRSERPSEPYSRGSPLDHHHHHQPPTSVPLERSHSGSSYFPPTVSPQPSQPPRSNYDSRHSSLDRGPYQPSQQPPPSRPLHSGPSSPRLRGGEADYHHQQHQHHQPPPPPAAYHHSNGISGSNSTSLPPLPPHHQQPPLPPPPSDYASSKWSVQHDLKSDYAAASNQIFGTYRAPHERVPVYVSGHGHQQHPPPSAPYDQDSAYGGTASSGGSVAGGPPASVYGGGVLQPPPTPSTTATTGSLSETGAAGGGGGPGGATATSAASPGTGSVGQPVKDALGPKIWTGSHFLPRFVRQAEVPGEGMCYFYDDGSHCKTVIDGEAVNAHWGVTKAGKPRKRLAIACITCREKKIKCDPDYPRCLQCEKFGRVCQFKNAPRGGGHNTTPATPPGEVDDSRMMRKYSEQHQQAHDSNTSSASVSPRPQMRQTSPPDSLGSSVPAKRMRLGYDDRDRVSTTNTPGASSENGTGGSVPPPPPMRLPSPSSSSSVPSLHNSNSAGSAPYQSSQWPAPGTSAGDGSRSVPPLLPPPTIGGACAGTGPLLPPPNGHHGSGSSSNGGSHHQRLLPVVGAVHSDHHHALGRAWHTDPYVSDPPRARALTASFFAHIDSTALRFLPRQAFVSWLFATANTEAEADGRGGGHDATPVAATTAVTVAPASSIEVAAEAANATAIATPAAATPPRPSHKAPPPPPPSLHAAPKSPDPTITTNTTATTTAVSSSSSPSHPAASAAAAAGRASGNAHTKSPEDLMLVYSILAVGAAFLHREYQRRRRDEDEDDDMEERLKKRKAGAAAQIDDDIDRDDNDKMDVDNDNEPTNSLGNDDYSLRLASRLGLHREARSLGAHYAAIVRYAQAHAGLSLQVVQARLLLSLYYLIVGRPCDSIEISGGAISAAVCMALNLEPEEETLLALRQEEDDNVDETMGGDVADDQEEDGMGKKRAAGSTSREPRYPWNMTRTQYIECRRRTYWACFVYERLDGSFPTRLSNLSAEDVFIRLPEREGVFDIEVGAPPIMVKASVMFDPSLANMALLDDDRTDCAVLGPLALVVTATVVWGDVMTNVYRMGQQHVRLLGRQSVPNSFGAFYAGATARLGRWRDAVRSQGFDLLADSHEERAGVVRRAVREGSLSSLLLAHLVHHVTAIKLHRHVTPRFWQQQKDGEVEGRLTRQSFAATARRHAQAILDAVAAVGSIFVGRFERHMAPLLVVDRQAPINRRSADRRRRQGDDDKDADATNPHGLNLPPPFLSHALLEAVDVLSSGGSATCLGRLVADLRAAHAVLTVLAAVWEAARLQADMVAARIDRFEDIMVEAEMMKTAKEPVKKDDADAGRPAGARTTGGNGNSNTAAGGKFRVFVDMDGDVSWRMLEPMDKRFARALDTVYPEE